MPWQRRNQRLSAVPSLVPSLPGHATHPTLVGFGAVAMQNQSSPHVSSTINTMTESFPAGFRDQLNAAFKAWDEKQNSKRLWERDATLWTGQDEAKWLEWMSIVDDRLLNIDELVRFSDNVKRLGLTTCNLLGMGGSSLCPEVLATTFGKIEGFPQLRVLDSTDPHQVRSFEKGIDFEKALFIVASKSGSTLEPTLFEEYFFARAAEVLGSEKKAAERFVAITDPGSQLEALAQKKNYRQIFSGVAAIGGRYSALSNFGLVAAAAQGLDLKAWLGNAKAMVDACGAKQNAESNPGVRLGLAMGLAANEGRDKLTLLASAKISGLAAWLEQLIAESTGKNGKGIIPVAFEPETKPSSYSQDRLFVYLRLQNEADPEQDQFIAELEKAGQPVLRLELSTTLSLAQEFYRWEIATAVAGHAMKIHPFDQPDVEASKIETKKLTSQYEATGNLPGETPLIEDDEIALYADPLFKPASKTVDGVIRDHLGRISTRDYFAILAYIEMNTEHEKILNGWRSQVLERFRVATCLGFGPRFLHSTGQAYKGGPGSGVFLQLTAKPLKDLAISGRKFTFGLVEAAQARGDFEVLKARGRRSLRVHFKNGDLKRGLQRLTHVVAEL